VKATHWIRAVDVLVEDLDSHAEYLDGLDAAIGDGEHGTTMLRSFRAVQRALRDVLEDLDSDVSVLQAIGATLSRAAGGAAGALYSSFFHAMGMAASAEDSEGDSVSRFVSMLTAGVSAVQRLGRAQPGDKTMLDTLVPALEAAREAEREGRTISEALAAVVEAGEVGMAGTREMKAKKGRASYLGDRSIGHQDPGATSASMILRAIQRGMSEALGKPG